MDLTIDAHIDLAQANQADAVLIGSGMKTRDVARDNAIMSQIQLNPERQLIAAQCSGTFLLGKLGLLSGISACTDLTSKPWVIESGVNILNQAFFAKGNIATAGGCLSAQYLSAWIISKLKDIETAREVLYYFAPVGEKEEYSARAMQHITANP